MFTLLKKRFGASPGMRIIVALLYGLVNFTVLLNHTCYSNKEDLHGWRFKYSSCHFEEGRCAEARLKFELNQNNPNGKIFSDRQYCTACLYSLTSKLYKLNPPTPLVSVEAVVKVQFIYHLNFTKQFEWLSSAPLRAPPIVTS